MSDDSYSTFFVVIVILWLLVITIFLIGVSVAVFQHRIELGPTGPTGPAAGSGVGTTALTLQNALNQGVITPTNCNQMGTTACNCNNGVGAVLNTASCTNCNFNTANGVSQFQLIEGNNVPQIVNFVLTTNAFTYDGLGTFILPAGNYQLSTTIVYNNNNLNNTKFLTVWLRDVNQNNVVSTNDLVGPIVNSNSQTLVKSATFVVSGIKNRLSILTWHGLVNAETIDNRSQFNLRRIS